MNTGASPGLLVLSRADIARLMTCADYVDAVEAAFCAAAAGRVALWTKADSVTYFDDLVFKALA